MSSLLTSLLRAGLKLRQGFRISWHNSIWIDAAGEKSFLPHVSHIMVCITWLYCTIAWDLKFPDNSTLNHSNEPLSAGFWMGLSLLFHCWAMCTYCPLILFSELTTAVWIQQWELESQFYFLIYGFTPLNIHVRELPALVKHKTHLILGKVS